MNFSSLKSKLLLTVLALVICSSLFVSLLVTQRHWRTLFETATAQAKSLAQSVALNATDKILINDLMALQQMLDYQVRSNPSIAYLFVSMEDQILAHTFIKGFPIRLIKANRFNRGNHYRLQRIRSTAGEFYLDIAWPIFAGKAGILRLGLSEKPYRRQLRKLWFQMIWCTLGILLLSLMATLFFVDKVTRPLVALAAATKEVVKGDMSVQVQVKGRDEVARLATSFNHMVDRMEDYTRKLEEQTMELERTYCQTRAFCSIIQKAGTLHSLEEICFFLIRTCQNTLKCDHIVLLIFNDNRDVLYASSADGIRVLKQPHIIQSTAAQLDGLTKTTCTQKKPFRPPLVPFDLEAALRQVIIPIRHNEKEVFGALVITCLGDCRCNYKDVEMVSLLLDQVCGIIKRALFQEVGIRDLQSRLHTSEEFCGIIGKDPKMQLIYKLIEDIAPTDVTALIEGESGTGKELVARAIHRLSPRKDNSFVIINCSAYPETLLESELFGHEKGAFTGAIRQKAGRFEQAHGGTVFLDEIGETHPSVQIKLLRVLQTQKFERLGGEKSLKVNVRILAATNKNLLQEVERGNFREDLYYRLNVIPIKLPPLRQRSNDIPLLAQHFLGSFCTAQGKEIEKFSPETMRLLLDYRWPGNVRELENSIEHAVVLAKDDQIEPTDLPVALLHASHSGATFPPKAGRLVQIMADHEKVLLHQVLVECGWNKRLAARRLGISRNTLYEKLKKYQIAKPTRH